ncbi:MAG: alpha/beta hydrolase [Naasia sp.]|nr:alpha/beta hydrolase [Naasia sp.]
MEERVAAGDGTEIAYTWQPGERPVLLLHGFATTPELTWETSGVSRALREAGRGVLAVTLRGHGTSGKPTGAARYSARILADDATTVLDAAGVDRVDVVGHSLGSRVAWAFAQSSADRVGRLVLSGVGTREVFEGWSLGAVRALLRDGEPMADETATRLLTGAMALPGADPDALLAVVEGMSGSELAGRAAGPTLVVAGSEDALAADADVLADAIGADFAAVPKRSHLNLLSSRAFKQILLQFLT